MFNEMKKISVLRYITFIVVNISLVSSGHSFERPPSEIVNSFRAIGIEKTLSGIVEEIKKRNGAMLDSKTKQLSVSSSGKNLNSKIQLIIRKRDVDIFEIRSIVEKNTIPMICTTPINVMTITDMGAIYTSHYYDMGNEFLFSISIDRDTCKKFQ
jgi:hypothetical protein